MRNFKLPLIVTGVALVVAVIAGAIIVTSIHRSAGSRKIERAQQAGGGVAIATMAVVFPFWIHAAGKVGKARRERRLSASHRPKQPRR